MGLALGDTREFEFGSLPLLECGYYVKEVSENLGIFAHSLYKWLKQVQGAPEQRREEELLETKMTPNNGTTGQQENVPRL